MFIYKVGEIRHLSYILSKVSWAHTDNAYN